MHRLAQAMPARPDKPGKKNKEDNNMGITAWAQGHAHDYGGLEDKIPQELMNCFDKCDERYPVLNQITQILHLMCIEDCRREFMARQGGSGSSSNNTS